MKKQINKGSFSLEIIAIVVCVILISVLGLRTFGEQISSTINETTNTIRNTTDNVLSQSDNGNTPTSGIDMSNINIADETTTIAAGDFSMIGNIVTINNKQFRVLASNGTIAKVVSINSAGEVDFNAASMTTDFGSETGQKYEGSTMDNAMTAYYDALPSSIQNAIVEQNINQSIYYFSEGTSTNADFSSWMKFDFVASDTSGINYYLQKVGEVNVGPRKVYALDVDDVIQYLGSVSTPQDINEMYWNIRTSSGKFAWLRSARSGKTTDAIGINGGFGGLVHFEYKGGNCDIHPAFVIDLSKLS